MATMRKYKHLESPEGIGEVWEKDKIIARVNYSLYVQQEIIIMKSFDTTDEAEGMKSISGSISVIEGEKHLFGRDRLTLNMQDGRKIDFFVSRFSPMDENIEIQPTGGFY